ncbi:acyl-CoA reductase [Chitinophaga horti]|uniref:Acyl-CoA reductase n=1 Tax=Chitinophaga horti TaxID=2920382 RepID=A0ABY6IYE1_9BACT|nr:acyl-CoA reductase [Chitinophaga horti]UYQ91109.1 acyl-CoA reductase [Chitinophaga horti]
MDISQKIAALVRLGQYLDPADKAGKDELEAVKQRAFEQNGWFTPEFIDLALANISRYYLDGNALRTWLDQYPNAGSPATVKEVGIVAAGNIPLVGFHDWLCGFLSGHKVRLKLSGKDEVLMKHILAKLAEWYPETAALTSVEEMLKNCDAYIATGSNNSARYFHYYFAKYPHIIRKNRTSTAVLTGTETEEELEALAADVMVYFGLGCRNVTKVYVPENYNFEPLLQALRKYEHLIDHNKYKNNYDYNLALLLLNNNYYMSSGSLLMQENPSLFSPLSVLHYEFYTDILALHAELRANDEVQCIVGRGGVAFGAAQQPSLSDYADGVDTMAFLTGL